MKKVKKLAKNSEDPKELQKAVESLDKNAAKIGAEIYGQQ